MKMDDMATLLPLARRHGLKVVEDAAHALPTTCGGQLVGTLGSDVTVFSFYANKIITTGEGGIVTTHDDRLAERMKRLRFHGVNKDSQSRYAKTASPRYEVVEPGWKYNMLDLQAALGVGAGEAHPRGTHGGFGSERSKQEVSGSR